MRKQILFCLDVAKEIGEIVRDRLSDGSRAKAYAVYGLFLLSAVVLMRIFFAPAKLQDPFNYVSVSGSVMYEDMSLIPAKSLTAVFVPLAGPNGDNAPRSGFADIDVKTGRFAFATTTKYGGGIVEGRHKVYLVADADKSGNALLAEEYTNFDATPLEISTADTPFRFVVKKPTPPELRNQKKVVP